MNELSHRPQSNLSDETNRLDQNPAAVYLAGLAPASRRTMQNALDIIAQLGLGDDSAACWDIPWERLRFQHTQALRSALADRYAHATANRMLSALRGVLKAAWKLELMTAEEYQRAASVVNVRGETVPAGRALAHQELTALLHSCDDSPLGRRDAAIITLLYGCGLRRAELVSLDYANFRRQENELLVQGKGNKQRALPLGHATPILLEWLQVRGNRPGPLFWGLGNRNDGRRLTDQAIYNMLRGRAKAVGLEHLSPHDLRRTFVGDLLDAGADLSTVQKMAGHASPTTTSRYDRRGQRAQHEAAALLQIPRQKLPIKRNDTTD